MNMYICKIIITFKRSQNSYLISASGISNRWVTVATGVAMHFLFFLFCDSWNSIEEGLLLINACTYLSSL